MYEVNHVMLFSEEIYSSRNQTTYVNIVCVLALKTIHTMYNQGLCNYMSLGSQLTLPVYFI
jgi:Pyruvate/2-oxoacid:ferredoxin oxidoreductase gamma subunit